MRTIESKYMTCPYCNFEDEADYLENEGTTKCESCGKEFGYFIEIDITYHTNTIDIKG